MTDTSILAIDYVSKNNTGLSHRIEMIVREARLTGGSTFFTLIGKVDNYELFSRSITNRDAATAHTVIRTTPVLLGPESHLLEVIEYGLDHLIENWSETYNSRTLSQRYYKAPSSHYLMVVDYVGDIAVDYRNIKLMYTALEPSNDNPSGLSLDDVTYEEIKSYKNALIDTYSLAEEVPGESIEIPPLDPGDSSADLLSSVELPANVSETIVVDAVSYVVRVSFSITTTQEASQTVSYKTEYGLESYTTEYSNKTVTFTQEEYGDAPVYLEAYAAQEIELLRQRLAGVANTPDLMSAGEGYVSYKVPQSDKNIVIKDSGQSYYVPLVPYVDTSDYIRVSQIPYQTDSDTLTYTGELKTPTWSSYSTAQIEMSGDLHSSEAGPHYALLTLKPGYCWTDGTTTPRSKVWNIKKRTVSVPSVTNTTFTYDKQEHGPSLGSYDTDLLVVSSNRATAAGTYTLSIDVKPEIAHNYEFTSSNTFLWKINKQTVDRPVAESLTVPFTNTETGLVLTGYDTDTMTATGITGLIAKAYTATFTLKDPDNYEWSTAVGSDTTSPHVLEWAITIAEIPDLSADALQFTYSPDLEHKLSIGNISADLQDLLIEQTGTDTAIEAGTYTARYELKKPGDSTFSDDREYVDIEWTILPAVPQYTLSQNNVEMSDSSTVTVTVTREGAGTLSVASDDLRVCRAQVSGSNTIRITPTGLGTTDVSVRIEATNNYYSVRFKIPVTSTYIPPLNTLDAAQIFRILSAGKFKDVPWQVGDYFTVPLYGTVGVLNVSGNYRAVLIGKDHNKDREGQNRLHFAICQNNRGDDIAFADHKYLTAVEDGAVAFCHNTTNYDNTGGWESSNLRTILQQFFAAMPDELQEILEGTNKLQDNQGSGTNLSSSVMPIRDEVWTLSEYEMLGTTDLSNPEESNCQEHYTYFDDHLTRKQHNMNRVVDLWTRSVAADDPSAFVKVSNNAAVVQTSNESLGVIPCFTISDGQAISLLDSVPWSRLSQLIQEGRIDEIATVGDTKRVDDQRRATLIGINHNTQYEGAGLLHFAIDKDQNNIPIANLDRNYGTTSRDPLYQQHSEIAENTGGWGASHLQDVLNDLYEDLPEGLKTVIVSCKKYTDNVCSTNSPDSVTITKSKLFLLSEYEVFGARSFANTTEQDYQQQYDYYKDHTPVYTSSLQPGSAISWWLRSPDIRNTTNYTAVDGSGNITTSGANVSLGIVPCFTLGSSQASNIIKDLTWGQIAQLAASGTISNYAEIGDTKQIHLDGDLGTSEISQSFKAVLIAINHNASSEGSGRAHFAIVRSEEDEEIAIHDNSVVAAGGLKTFSHNIQGNSNTGGWQLSNLRDICTDIYNCLDEDLKTAIIKQPKYTNNYGGSPADLSLISVSKTEDYIWIPSAKEFGATLSLQENEYQQPYSYFSDHKVHKSSVTEEPIDVWTRTPAENSNSAFVYLSLSGACNSVTKADAKISKGIVPCFAVGLNTTEISLEDLSWQDIQHYVQNNLLSRFVKPGSTKTVTLTGTVGATPVSGTYKAVLLDINHNPEVEGDLSAHFAICLNATDDPIAFVEDQYNTAAGYYRHRSSLTNTGGYASSTLRTTLNQFYGAMSSDLKAVIGSPDKYTNNNPAGAKRSLSPSISYTKDKIWTLSQIERSSASKDNQESYSWFYRNLRTKTFQGHNSLETVSYWLRDPADTGYDEYYYMAVTGASAAARSANVSLGLIPCFSVS